MHIMWYTNVDARCEKLVAVDRRVMANFGTKFDKEAPFLTFELFFYKTM